MLCLYDPAETEQQARHPLTRGADTCSTPYRQAGSESSRSTQSTHEREQETMKQVKELQAALTAAQID